MLRRGWTVIIFVLGIIALIGMFTPQHGDKSAPPSPVTIRSAPTDPLDTKVAPETIRESPTSVAQPEGDTKEWIKVKEWNGTSSKETEIFQMNSTEWRVNWTSSNDALFSIFVRDDTGKLVSLAANTLKAGSDTSYVHRRGQFYLKISAGDTRWSVFVEDKR